MVRNTQMVAVSINNGHAKAVDRIAKYLGWSRSKVYDQAIIQFIEDVKKNPEIKELNLNPMAIGKMVVGIEEGITKLREELPSLVKQSFLEELKELNRRLDVVEKNWGLRK